MVRNRIVRCRVWVFYHSKANKRGWPYTNLLMQLSNQGFLKGFLVLDMSARETPGSTIGLTPRASSRKKDLSITQEKGIDYVTHQFRP